MSTPNTAEAQKRIQFCHRKRRNHLNLAELGLRTADLDAIPEFAQLTQLEFLDLTGNELTELPRGLSRFTKLRWLGLNFNRLETLEGVEWLTSLERLYVRGNKLTELPYLFGNTEHLIELDLTGNSIQELPDSMGFLKKLEHIALEANHLVAAQRAAWEQGGWAAIYKQKGVIVRELIAEQTARVKKLSTRVKRLSKKEFEAWKQAARDRRRIPASIYAAKLILIGEKDHGKTCLQRALRNQPVKESEKSTEGMNRALLRLNRDAKVLPEPAEGEAYIPQSDALDFQVWDMGGQHDYRHMHQMFFSSQAIYLAVMFPRKGDSDHRLRKWLDLVQRRTQGNATVLIICTWGIHDPTLKLEDFQRDFPALNFRGIHVVNSSEDERKGIEELRKTLVEIMLDEKAPFAQSWSQLWTPIFQKLLRHPAEYLRWVEVVKLCEDDGKGVVEEDEQKTLLLAGHYMGMWLWRHDTPATREVVVLKPEWLNRAVARVLDHGPTQAKHGLIRIPELKKLWLTKPEGRDGAQVFPENSHAMLLHLMEEVSELAFRPKLNGQPDGDRLLLTQMVQDREPSRLAEVWPEKVPERYKEAKRTFLFAHPEGSLLSCEVPDLIYLLIFRLRSLSLGYDAEEQAVHWQTGLVVEDKNTHSIARIDLRNHELHVTLRYLSRDSLFDLIDHQIGADEDDSWNGLKKTRYLACGEACQKPKNDSMNGQGRVSEESGHKNMKKGIRAASCFSCHELVPLDELYGQTTADTGSALPSHVTKLIELIAAGGTDWQRQVTAKLDGLAEAVAAIRDEARSHASAWMNAFSSQEDNRPRLFSILPAEKEWWKTDIMETAVDITLWCEWSLAPVPFFGEKYGKDWRGTLRVKVGREWVKHAKRAMQFTKFALLAWKTGGLAAGEYVLPAEWKPQVDEWSKTQADFEKALKDDTNKELRAYLKQAEEADGEVGGYSKLGVAGYGLPKEQDAKFIHTMRELFVKHDSEWGGLKPVLEESRWYRVHPKWEQFGRKV